VDKFPCLERWEASSTEINDLFTGSLIYIAGLFSNDMGIMCFYSYQMKVVKNITVDAFQGRDDTRPNPVSILLSDERRLNVALTRARKKLIIIGNKCDLSDSYEPIKRLSRCLGDEQCVLVKQENVVHSAERLSQNRHSSLDQVIRFHSFLLRLINEYRRCGMESGDYIMCLPHYVAFDFTIKIRHSCHRTETAECCTINFMKRGVSETAPL
ncbi:unnamed protein product, partial [Soboliphyme baturini]|uniref:DNA replication ATP-dependent helicase/nuclease n=1 Tax=Soboliphyme baturini TaxID=241478 RepID=A0A183I935_9BILA